MAIVRPTATSTLACLPVTSRQYRRMPSRPRCGSLNGSDLYVASSVNSAATASSSASSHARAYRSAHSSTPIAPPRSLDRLRREPVERLHGQLEVLLLRVFEPRVGEPAQRLHEQHHRRDACASDLSRVVERTAREPVRRAGDLLDRLAGQLDQRLVEQDRLDVPDALPLDLDVLLLREAARRSLRVAQHLRKLCRVEVTLVEQTLGRLDDRRDDARFRHDAAHRGHGALPGPLRDLADLELETRSARQRVPPLVHRRRARVRGLPAERHLVALDSEGAEHDAEGEIHRLEDGTLLDVELEVRDGAFELGTSLERGVELDAMLAQRVRQRDPVRIL